MPELKPICAIPQKKMLNPCDGAILCYAKDDVDEVLKSKDETIKKLQDAADTKDACILRMKEKITDLEKNLWDLQRKPHTDCGSQVERFQEENKALKSELMEAKELLQAFQKRYND